MLPSELADTASRQHGLLTRKQVLEIIDRGRMDRLVSGGVLERSALGVYRITGAPVTWHQRLLTAVLVGGPKTVASFRSAARLHDLDHYEADTLEITTTRIRRARLEPVIVHQSTILPRRHRTVVDGIPATTAARTLCDLTAIRPRWSVERAVDRALRAESTSWAELARVARDIATKGRRRSRTMRAILEARVPGIDPGDSPREVHVAELLVRAGLPPPVQQHPVTVRGITYRIDLSYPDHLLALEYDGWDAHRGRSSFDHDRVRQNHLSTLGWRFLRFTSAMTDRQIVEAVQAMLNTPDPASK